jgi:hypothetical protein
MCTPLGHRRDYSFSGASRSEALGGRAVGTDGVLETSVPGQPPPGTPRPLVGRSGLALVRSRVS